MLQTRSFIVLSKSIAVLSSNTGIFVSTSNEISIVRNFCSVATIDFEKNFEKTKISISNSSKVQYTNYNVTGKELIYESNNEVKHGFIDLMLEYNNHIDIIDYKMKNITDENYIKQLNGYKEYIKSISKKDVNIYLYSIIDDKLEKLN